VALIEGRDLEALIHLFENSQWKEFELRIGDCEVYLSKDPAGRATWGLPPPPTPAQPAFLSPKPSNAPAIVTTGVPPGEATAAFAAPEGCVVVTATSLGTFYRAGKPGAPPFVEIGQKVDNETELCLIEVMKLFTTLRAETSGTVKQILANDGDLVVFGQPLFVIDGHA